MADTRTRMLASVRQALGRTSPPDPAVVAAEAAALSVDAAATQPALKLQDPLAEFMARVQGERLAATVERIPDDAAIPARHRTLSAGRRRTALPRPTAGPGNGKLGLDGIETHRTLDPNEGAAISRAHWGIAETGSLILLSSSGTAHAVCLPATSPHHCSASRQRGSAYGRFLGGIPCVRQSASPQHQLCDRR